MSDGLEPVYILHARPYRDTSLLLDLLGRNTGRFGAVARGARSDRSKHRGRLQPFTPLLVATVGRGELKTMSRVEFPGQAFQPRGDNLMLGLYVNELLYRLLGSFDPVTQLFDEYHDLLVRLSSAAVAEEALAVKAVRWFELCVLQELGYGINFDHDSSNGNMIVAEKAYRFVVDEGFREAGSEDNGLYPGSELLHLASGDVGPVDEKRLLHVTRSSLARLLGEKPLKSRALFRKQLRKEAR